MNQQRRVEWSRLDNASKYFAATYSERDEKVFRISCELFEGVEPEILQQALDETIERFPYYRSVLRRGIFWYYLENSDIHPLVEKESKPVCAPIYREHERKLLFRVLYYNKRISIEVFHALSDGSGALRFMMTLVYHYLLIKHGEEFSGKIPELNYNASISEKRDDSFNRYYQGRHFKKKVKRKNQISLFTKVYRIRGTRLEENRMKIIEGAMSAKAVLDEAHKYNTTMTVFLSALLFRSIYMDMPVRKKDYPLVLVVPINLRQFFKSETSSNFFSTMNISYRFGKDSTDLNEIIGSLNESFRRELTEERLNEQLYWQMSIEKNPFARIMPLPIKNISIRIADAVVEMGITASISNLGKINMPSEFESYIRQFSVIPNVKRPQLAVCTYGDRLVVTFASPFEETEVQKNFFKSLSEMGIRVEISSNM